MSTVCLLDQRSQLWLASVCLSAASSVTLIRNIHQLIFIQLLEKHVFQVKLFQEWNQALSRAIEDLKSRNKRKEGLDNNWVSVQVFSTTGLVFPFVWWSLRVTDQSRLQDLSNSSIHRFCNRLSRIRWLETKSNLSEIDPIHQVFQLQVASVFIYLRGNSRNLTSHITQTLWSFTWFIHHVDICLLFVPMLVNIRPHCSPHLICSPTWWGAPKRLLGQVSSLGLGKNSVFDSTSLSSTQISDLLMKNVSCTWYAPVMDERKNTISANSKVPLFQKLGFL